VNGKDTVAQGYMCSSFKTDTAICNTELMTTGYRQFQNYRLMTNPNCNNITLVC